MCVSLKDSGGSEGGARKIEYNKMLEERTQAGHAAAETRAGTGQQSAVISRGNGKRRMHAEGGVGSWEATLFILTVAGKKKIKPRHPHTFFFSTFAATRYICYA